MEAPRELLDESKGSQEAPRIVQAYALTAADQREDEWKAGRVGCETTTMELTVNGHSRECNAPRREGIPSIDLLSRGAARLTWSHFPGLQPEAEHTRAARASNWTVRCGREILP